jgi:hypothetical protein
VSTYRFYSPAIVSQLSELAKSAWLLALLTFMCLVPAIVDGFWPAAIVAGFNGYALASVCHRFHKLCERAAMIYVARTDLARQAGQIAQAQQLRRRIVYGG